MDSVKIFKSLADSSRLKILNTILLKPHSVEEIAAITGLSVSTVSFHLQKLTRAGLSNRERMQYYSLFSAKSELLEKKLSELISPNGIDNSVISGLEEYNSKVLRTFLSNGKIIKMPVQKKKQMVIINYIASFLESGKNYTESEINEFIKIYYDDYCLIRRIFIEEKIMEREKGIYRSLKEKKAGGISRKEIKRSVKQQKTSGGILLIRNKSNNKFWFDGNRNIDSFMKRIEFELKTAIFPVKELLGDWQNNPSDFVFEIVERLEPKGEEMNITREEVKEAKEKWEKLLSSDIELMYEMII